MKILVVGCGSIGRRHAANIAKKADLGLVDAEAYAAKQTAKETGGCFFSDLEAGLAWAPDAVIVAVPNDEHIPVAYAAIEAGADILIEKPISHAPDKVNEFLDHARALGRKVFVGCNMRFHPGVAALKKNLEYIGKPLFARAHVGNYLPNMRPGADYRKLYCASRVKGGGVILDGIHEVDYLCWLFGNVSDVSCRATRLGDLDIDVEDFACLCLEHGTGVVSEVQMDYLRPFKRRGCEIVGTDGMLLWGSEGKNPEHCTVRLFQNKIGSWETLVDTDDFEANEPYLEMLEHFLAALDGKDTPLLSGDQALAELLIAHEALIKAGLIQ